MSKPAKKACLKPSFNLACCYMRSFIIFIGLHLQPHLQTKKGFLKLKKVLLTLAFMLICGNTAFAVIITEIQVTDDVEIEDVMGEDEAATNTEPTTEELTNLSLTELTALAEDSNADALLALGDRYYYGKGGAGRDRYQAFKWYSLAAELDCVASQFNLGHMYRNGTGTKQNMQKSLEWFERAADLGDAESQFMAAEMHGTGSGVPRDLTKAYMWYKIAYTTMEPRFRNIAKAEMDLLKPEMTKEQIAEAEKLAAEWYDMQVHRMQAAQGQ